MTKPMTMMDAGTARPTGQGRKMGRSIRAAGITTVRVTPIGETGKVLEFSMAYPGKRQERHSWSERAGVTNTERMMALMFGALITPTVWAGHSLLVWLHLL